jgi:hypothetical protein
MPFPRSDSWFHLGWLRVVNHDSQRANFQGLPPAKGKLVRWLVGGEVFASRSLFRSEMGSVGLARRRQDGQNADRRSAHDVPFPTPFDLSIRLATRGYSSQKESTGDPSCKTQMELRDRWFSAFALCVSQEGRCKLPQAVMRGKHIAHRGVLRMAMEIKVSRSRGPMQDCRRLVEGRLARWNHGFRGGANLMRSTSRTTSLPCR